METSDNTIKDFDENPIAVQEKISNDFTGDYAINDKNTNDTGPVKVNQKIKLFNFEPEFGNKNLETPVLKTQKKQCFQFSALFISNC